MNDNFEFWKLAYDMKCADIEMLKQVVKTDGNIYGEITSEEFKEITGEEFSI
ncbi:XkdX family protein [Clostridium baratii]